MENITLCSTESGYNPAKPIDTSDPPEHWRQPGDEGKA